MNFNKATKIITDELARCEASFPHLTFNYKTQYFAKNNTKVIAFFSPRKNKLAFNHKFISSAKKKFLREIARHEIGHLITAKLHPEPHVTTHGKEWRAVMHKLGSVKPRATMDFSEKSETFTTHYVMKCDCKEHMFTKNKRTRLRRGTTYKCDNCSTNIVENKPYNPFFG